MKQKECFSLAQRLGWSSIMTQGIEQNEPQDGILFRNFFIQNNPSEQKINHKISDKMKWATYTFHKKFWNDFYKFKNKNSKIIKFPEIERSIV